MKAPNAIELSGLWKALNVAEATPVGGDFDEHAKYEVDAAIAWLAREQPLRPRMPRVLPSPERICPDCRAERADYEPGGVDGRGGWLPMCPNCGSRADPEATP